MWTLQFGAISTGFTDHTNNSERCVAPELRSDGTPLHRLPSPPPIGLNWAPVRQWQSLRVGGSARQRSFWLCYVREAILKNHPCCAVASHRAATCKLLFTDFYTYCLHVFQRRGESRDGSDRCAVELPCVAKPPEVCAFFRDSSARTLLRLDYALREPKTNTWSLTTRASCRHSTRVMSQSTSNVHVECCCERVWSLLLLYFVLAELLYPH